MHKLPTENLYFNMKKLSLYIFLVLMWCNVGFAEKISFLDIKIGDKITDHFTSNQINKYYMDDEENTTNSKGERVYGREVIYSFIAIANDREIFKEDYSNSGIQIYYKNETDKIVSFGKVDMATNLNNCILERNKDASNYKKKNRITSLFNKDEGTHKFPDGMADHYVSFSGKEKFFSFRCYVYPDGAITKRYQVGTYKFNDYVFEKFNN